MFSYVVKAEWLIDCVGSNITDIFLDQDPGFTP
jgi:hypothetical protein